MIYLNDADGRKERKLGAVIVPSPLPLLETIIKFTADSLTTNSKNIFFAQNISTHVANIVDLIAQKYDIHRIWVDGSEVRWIPDQLTQGNLIESDMTYPNYAASHGLRFAKSEVQVFNPYDKIDYDTVGLVSAGKVQIIIISHVSRLDGVEFPIEQIYRSIKRVSPDTIVIVDGAQSLGAMRVDVSRVSDIYIATSSKFMGGEPSLGIAYISSGFQERFLSENGYPEFCAGKYNKELYSAYLAIQTICPNYESHIQKLKEHAVQEFMHAQIPVFIPKNQVSHFLTFKTKDLSEAKAKVSHLARNGIQISHNMGFSTQEPTIPLLRVSVSARTTKIEINKLLKNL